MIDDPIAVLAKLGNLHDARIDKTIVDTDAQTLSLHLEDLNARIQVCAGNFGLL